MGTTGDAWRSESSTARRHLYERLADHVAARITFGDISPGALAPGDLAREYGVSLQTVHKALRTLREWGIVRTTSKGVFVLPLHE
ncbi:GntR family transcriptional regulator [Kibdelosporangium aridum]|uniref:GntR family transcriptional regulator n=1 Tax=Kibdelosporangium aridum TaxID=2030 RepID=UPI0035EA4E5F